MRTLEAALRSWRALLGADYVLTDERTLAEVQTATFSTTQQVPALIRPADRREVQQCLKIANKHKIPIYPISTGKNWGYGSRVPVRDQCVVMELSRLNRIVDYNEQLAYVVVEPGVTMGQLNEFLKEHKAPLKMSLTGSTLSSSVVGNVLERGLGSGQYGDRFDHVCGFEVILPTGECIHCGFGHWENARAAPVHRWGVGPYLDGLFTQSNLGVVTRMTLWLMPVLDYRQTCLCSVHNDDALEGLVDVLHTLKFQGIFSEPIHLYNDYKILSLLTQYPWSGAEEPGALSPEMMVSIRKALGIGSWNGVIGLHAVNEQLGLALREVVRQTLGKQVDELYFLGAARGETDTLAREEPFNFFSMGGRLSEMSGDGSIRSTYWRKRTPLPSTLDPDRDHCGVIWYAPCAPFQGRHVKVVVNLIKEICASYRFEPHISIICATERSAIINAALLYDRDIAGADQHALLCYKELLQKGVEQGYFPYRLGIQSMNALPAPDDDYGTFLATIKSALDPNMILAPGRYDFQKDWPTQEVSL